MGAPLVVGSWLDEKTIRDHVPRCLDVITTHGGLES